MIKTSPFETLKGPDLPRTQYSRPKKQMMAYYEALKHTFTGFQGEPLRAPRVRKYLRHKSVAGKF